MATRRSVRCSSGFGSPSCSSFPRKSFTREQQDLAGIPGIADARIWADDPAGLSRTALFSYGQHKPASIDILALSGGGAEGAFGAGLLVGWTEAGNRPEFSMISGTSSGALIAPFAFLGASHDPTLKKLFTGGFAETLLHVMALTQFFGSGVFKTEPLKLLIAHYVDEDLLQLVAIQHRRGRRLFIVTTNIDAQRTAVWNMGAIAASDYSGRLQLFRDILVASASAPGLFAPAYIEVQAGNARFQEMHVDGAVTSNVLAVPESVLLQKVVFKNAAKPKLYIIVNGKITSDFAVIGDARSQSLPAHSTRVSRRIGQSSHHLLAAHREHAKTTWCPCSASTRPAISPRPVDEPVMNTRDMFGQLRL